jgi:hypothetical protein
MGFRSAHFGTWGAPPDAVAYAALLVGLGFAVAAVVPRSRKALERAIFETPRVRFAWFVAMAAALLSLGYVAHVLRGGPRIVDATTYLLEARTFATGHFSFPAGFPSASTRGRFLVYDEAHGSLAGLFPPGYPLVLSLGVHLGAPLAIGPVLAAGLALATLVLGARVARELGHSEASAERIGRAAALFSVGCAVLRYHTADTMSHGLAALYTTLALIAALGFRASSSVSVTHALLVGLALGGLVATRPVSVAAPALACSYLMFAASTSTPRTRAGVVQAAAAMAVGSLPGLALLVAWQHAVTGHAFGSPQLVYYATSDGPPGCFRYGFGAGIGCLFEHGDFVRHNLPNRYGAWAALGTTARRLKMHLSDAANLELFAPVLVYAMVAGRKTVPGRALVLVVLGQIAAYVPFYFDGNFPGGGARFFAEVLPVEHVLLALAVSPASWGGGAKAATMRPTWLFTALAVSLVGFAFHTSFDHLALAEREGGEPFFLRDELDRAKVIGGLVFVDTDHGFSLGHTPLADPTEEPRIVRWRDDDHDWLVFDSYGRPPTYRYRAEPGTKVGPWAPSPPEDGVLRFESEADWPPLTQSGGYATPMWKPEASGGRALVLVPTAEGPATTEIAVPIPRPGTYLLVARVQAEPGTHGTVSMAGAEAPFLGTGTWMDLPAFRLDLPRGETRLRAETTGGALALDRVLLTELSRKPESPGTSKP